MNAAHAIPTVEVRDISVCYGDVEAVHRASFELRPGEHHVLLGESGSGKTTILRTIAGFQRVARGRILVRGRAVDVAGERNAVPPERRNIGVVFQDSALFQNMSVRQNVSYGMSKGQRGTATEWLDRLGVSRLAERRPSELSGGESQRVALARSLAASPMALLLDEPFSNLNRSLRRELREATCAVLRDNDMSAIFVTHDPDDAFSIADRVSILHEGAIVQSGTPRDVYERPADAAAARSLGDCLIVPATLRGNGRAADCVFGALRLRENAKGDFAVIRPHQIEVQAADTAGAAARVLGTRFAGGVHSVDLQCGEFRLQVPVAEDLLPHSEKVSLRVSGRCWCVPDNGSAGSTGR